MHATIVPITENNIEDLVDLSVDLAILNCLGVPCDRRFVKGIARGINLAPHLFLRMAQTVDGACVGLVAAGVDHLWYSPVIEATLQTLYVRKVPFRASIAKQLLQAAEQWAVQEKGASYLRAAETSGIAPVAVDFFLRSQGYKQAGTIYKKGVV